MSTGELLRLNGLPSTYRIYSGQHLTVFENATSGAPEVTKATEKRNFELPDSKLTGSGSEVLKSSKEGVGAEASNRSPSSHRRSPSTAELELNFTTVITPSYRSVPLLAQLRQTRDKKYFGDGKHGTTVTAGVSDSLTATMSRHSSSLQVFASGFHHPIPEEMRLSSRNLVKEQVRYYINEQRNVFGELTVMPTSIIFEPALDDPVTRQLGLLNCQFQCDLKDILDVHVIEASEILGWWKAKSNSKASSAASTSAASATGQAQATPSSQASPPAARRGRTGSQPHGPSWQHLNTGSNVASSVPSPSATESPSKMIDARLGIDDLLGGNTDRSPRFLQLTVLFTKQAEGSQVGKIVYFLINRQSIDTVYQKLEAWCAQARPSMGGNNGGGGGIRKPAPNILKPQLGLYERHERDRLSGGSSPSFDPTISTSPPVITSSSSPANNRNGSEGDQKSSPSPSSSSSITSSDSLIEVPKLNLPSVLLTNDTTIAKLAGALPVRYRHSDWTLLYSTERHGVSLMTFFNKTKRKGPSVLIIEDDAGFRFGAFISTSWEPQRSYYGTGECFLFTLYPSFNIYPWSQLNEYFIYSKEDTIALGGGSGKFALWLDKDLMQGSSAPCETFLNSTLSYQEDFKPVIVEVWGFNDAMSSIK
jgi:hypothetical protein